MKSIMKFLVMALLCISMYIHCTQPKEQNNTAKLSLSQNMGVGTVTGAAAMAVYLPFNFRQNESIRGNPLVLNPRQWKPRRWWAGLPAAVVSVGAQTAMQTAGYEAVMNQLQDPTFDQKVAIAVPLSAGTGVMANAAEFVAAQQQKNDESARTVIRKHGARSLTRAATVGAARDGIFGTAYLVGCAKSQELVQQATGNKKFAKVAGPVLAGVAAAVLTQPCNRIRTELHDDPQRLRFNGPYQVLKTVTKKEGVRALWKGGSWRAIGIGAALLAMNVIKGKTTTQVQHYNQTHRKAID